MIVVKGEGYQAVVDHNVWKIIQGDVVALEEDIREAKVGTNLTAEEALKQKGVSKGTVRWNPDTEGSER